jgi:flagellar biogenesis protein FliO
MQSVKTQLKVEQLHKFKETLKTNTTASTNKRENHQLKPFLSTLKQPLKPNYNT